MLAADWRGFRTALSGCRSARCGRRLAGKLLYGGDTVDEVQGPGWGMNLGVDTHLHHYHLVVGRLGGCAWCMESLWRAVDMVHETPRPATRWTDTRQSDVYSPLTRNKAGWKRP